MKNNQEGNTQKALTELENLFVYDLVPETAEEAQEILAKAGIDTSELKQKGREILRNILIEFDDDWRNITDESVKAEASKVLERKIFSSLSRDELLRRIKEVSKLLSTTAMREEAPAGVLHRNLGKVKDQDLASLLRQLEHLATEAGLDLGKE